jgi:hypothetical protein
MRAPKPLGLIQLAVLSSGVLTVVITCMLIVGHDDAWWAWGFPREVAMYRLEHAANYFDFGGCPYAPAQSWQLLRNQPNAAELFDSVAIHAQTAAGRVMAEAGLMAGGDKPRVHAGDSRVVQTDSIHILWAWDRKELVSLDRALESPLIDSVLALMQRPLSGPEC